MPRYTPGTKLDYAAFDREGILARRLDPTGHEFAPVIHDIARIMTRNCKTPGSVISYGQELRFYLRWCAAHGIEPFAIEAEDAFAYAADLSGYAQGTQHLKLLVARQFHARAIKHAAKLGLSIDENPFETVAFPTRLPETITPCLTSDQVATVLSAIRAEFYGPAALTAKRDFTLIMLMVRLALRTTETASLRWGRLQTTSGETRANFIGKGLKPGHLYLPDDVRATLADWKAAYEATTGVDLGPADPIFPGLNQPQLLEARNRKGASPLRPMRRERIYRLVTDRLRDVGIEGDRMSPHCLRATGAALAYLAGAKIPEVQAMLRHSSPVTTMRYLSSILGGAERNAIDLIRIDVPNWNGPSGPASATTPRQAA